MGSIIFKTTTRGRSGGNAAIPDGSITEPKLSASVQNKLNAGANSLRYDAAQTLTMEEQQQALDNAGLNVVIVSESELSTTLSEERAAKIESAAALSCTTVYGNQIYLRGNNNGGLITFYCSRAGINLNVISFNISTRKLSGMSATPIDDQFAVKFNTAQTLTETQQERALANLGIPTVFLAESELNTNLSASRGAQVEAAAQIAVQLSTGTIILTRCDDTSDPNAIRFKGFSTVSRIYNISYFLSTRLASVSIQNISDPVAVKTSAQTWASAQQSQARANIAAMADTPSGDPMHYMYEAAGAVYDADSDTWSYTRRYSYVPRDFTVDNLSTEDVRQSYMDTYAQCSLLRMDGACSGLANIKFAFTRIYQRGGFTNTPLNMSFAFNGCSSLQMFVGIFYSPQSALYCFNNCTSLKSVAIGANSIQTSADAANMFTGCTLLVDLYLTNLHVSISLQDSPLLSPASLAWTIKNSRGNTIAYTITLHHDAYIAAMADAAVQAALEAMPNVTLADASGHTGGDN